MAEFSAIANLQVQVDEASLRQANNRISRGISDPSVGGGSAAGGGQRRVTESLVALAEERNELLEELTRGGDGGGGGGFLGGAGAARLLGGGGAGGLGLVAALLAGGVAGTLGILSSENTRVTPEGIRVTEPSQPGFVPGAGVELPDPRTTSRLADIGEEGSLLGLARSNELRNIEQRQNIPVSISTTVQGTGAGEVRNIAQEEANKMARQIEERIREQLGQAGATTTPGTPTAPTAGGTPNTQRFSQ